MLLRNCFETCVVPRSLMAKDSQPTPQIRCLRGFVQLVSSAMEAAVVHFWPRKRQGLS